MIEEVDRRLMLQVAWSYHGTFYSWGGDDPSAFDCSGLVVECAKSIGKLPRRGDWTAQGLRGRFTPINYEFTTPGDLVFWRRPQDDTATHVGILWDPTLYYLGAEGGGRAVKTRDDAIKGNAFIKLRPVLGRGSTLDRVYATL